MGEAALNQFSQELGDTFQVLCCGARPYGTQTPWAPVSQPAQRVQPKPPDVRQSLSRKQVSPHFWPTGRGAGVGGREARGRPEATTARLGTEHIPSTG